MRLCLWELKRINRVNFIVISVPLLIPKIVEP